MPARVLITGAAGQLGQAIAERLAGRWEVVARARRELDIADERAVRAAVEAVRPDWIVNCAAWTDVDGAEADERGAFRVNDEAVGALARTAAATGARVLHFGTDYVFDGESPRPYVETDEPRPLSVYGASKLAGERRLLESGAHAAVLRTSWLYSATGRNFLLTILRLGRAWRDGDPPLRVVDDQIGTPTDAPSLAAQAEVVLEHDLEGLFHASCEGRTTWYGFAAALLREAGVRAPVEPITTAEFPRPARRPAFSVLENRRLGELGLAVLPPWEEGLARVLAAVGEGRP